MKIFSILILIISILTFSSCEEESIIGCIDSTAINYNSDATQDDGSCEYPLLGCTDPSALNYDSAATESDNSCEYVSDQILGSWTVDSVNMNALFSEDMINNLISASLMMSPYEFEDEMGFPVPSSQAEWDEIALNGVPMPIDQSENPSSIVITNSTFTINEMDEFTELYYQLTNDQTIEFSSTETDFEYFDIVQVSESNLVLTTTSSNFNDDMDITGMTLLVYLSK